MRRESNIELLRIVAMTMIVIGHFIVHGSGGGYFIHPVLNPVLKSAIYPFCACGVNLFFMISGYFRIKPTSKNICNLIVTLLFFGMVNVLLLAMVGHDIAIRSVVSQIFFPISRSPYWFIQVYFLLMICAPLINAGIDSMSASDYRKFMFLFTVVTIYSCGIGHNMSNNNGYTFLQSVYMYCLAAFVRNEKERFDKFKSWHYLIAYFVITAIGILGSYLTGRHDYFISYHSAINIFASLSLFIFFCKLQFSSILINNISTAALGCYLLQDGLFGFKYFYSWCNNIYLNYSLPKILVYHLVIFIAFWVVSWVLTKICRSLSDAISARLL